MPVGDGHAASVKRSNRVLGKAFGDTVLIGVQDPIRLADSEPEPDISLLIPRDDFYASGKPRPADILLLIEVADTSLDFDREVKRPLYAEAGTASSGSSTSTKTAWKFIAIPCPTGGTAISPCCAGGRTWRSLRCREPKSRWPIFVRGILQSMAYWLFKADPAAYSFADLWAEPGPTAGWDGVRNFQARNSLRDQVTLGDGVLFYHSNADPPCIAGIAEVVKTAPADPTAFDPKDSHYDPKSKRDSPTWFQVSIKAVRDPAPAGPSVLAGRRGALRHGATAQGKPIVHSAGDRGRMENHSGPRQAQDEEVERAKPADRKSPRPRNPHHEPHRAFCSLCRRPDRPKKTSTSAPWVCVSSSKTRGRPRLFSRRRPRHGDRSAGTAGRRDQREPPGFAISSGQTTSSPCATRSRALELSSRTRPWLKTTTSRPRFSRTRRATAARSSGGARNSVNE